MTKDPQHSDSAYLDVRPHVPLDPELHLTPPFAALFDVVRRPRAPRLRASASRLRRLEPRLERRLEPRLEPGL